MIDDQYVNSPAKTQLCGFHLHVIHKSVLDKFIKLCMESPCLLCPSKGHQHCGQKVTETSAIEFCYLDEKLLL